MLSLSTGYLFQSLDASTKVTDVSGKIKISAKKIITMGVKYLKGEIMKAINQQQNQKVVDEDDVLFVLTVPAVWDDRAKLLMREAAIDVSQQSAYIISLQRLDFYDYLTTQREHDVK